jgi:hypothetical protein
MGGRISNIIITITYSRKGKKGIVEGHAADGQGTRKALVPFTTLCKAQGFSSKQ